MTDRYTARALAFVTATLLALPGASMADSESWTGTFQDDDQRFVLDFTLAAGGALGAQTLSYAGGVDADGQVVADGGFAPVLALYDLATHDLVQLAIGSTSACATSPASASSGFAWDACFAVVLPAGAYELVLTQDDNTPLGGNLADGYTHAGDPRYTAAYVGGDPDDLSLPGFYQVDGTQRTGGWAFDLSGAFAAAVPEPGAGSLLLAGALMLALRARRRRTPR